MPPVNAAALTPCVNVETYSDMRTFAVIVRSLFTQLRRRLRNEGISQLRTYESTQHAINCVGIDFHNAMAFAEGIDIDYYNV